jgi:hypothetical protein
MFAGPESTFSSSYPQDLPIGEQIISDSSLKSIDVPIAYRPMELYIDGVTIPVAMWYPVEKKDVGGGGGRGGRDDTIDDKGNNNRKIQPKNSNLSPVSYDHKISVRRIGQLLARWEFIPGFVEQEFALKPTVSSILDGTLYPLPTCGPVVLLAHGYLGSRFDLSHLAEALAREGKIWIYIYVIVLYVYSIVWMLLLLQLLLLAHISMYLFFIHHVSIVMADMYIYM